MSREKGGALGGLTAMVAEDQLMVRVMLMDMLEELGAEAVHSVSRVEEIENAVERIRPDVATLDINFGHTPIYDTALSLWEHGIPFIFVSGYKMQPGFPSELKDIPHVKKPLRLRELSLALEIAIGLSADCRR